MRDYDRDGASDRLMEDAEELIKAELKVRDNEWMMAILKHVSIETADKIKQEVDK